MKSRNTGTLLLIIAISLTPVGASALELSYPSFLPLHEEMQLNELVQALFSWFLVLGAIAAFISLIYAGFQYIISGDDPSKRSDSRKRLIAVFSGTLILLSSVTFLRLINPNLITLPEIERIGVHVPLLGTPSLPQPGFIAGENFGVIHLEQEIKQSAELTERIEQELPSLLGAIPNLVAQCSADLCLPGQASYSAYLGDESCNCRIETICLFENQGECFDQEVCDSCPICAPATCTGSSCEGEPLPRREEAPELIEEVQSALDALLATSNLLVERRVDARACEFENEASLLPCTTAQALGIAGAAQCAPGEDFFCVAPASSFPISLPIQAWMDDAETLADTLAELASFSGSGSCALTEFACPNGGFCQRGSGVCSDRQPNEGGCPPALRRNAEQFLEWSKQLREQRSALEDILFQAQQLDELALAADQSVTILSCPGARELVERIIFSSEERYRDNTCIEGTSCCPSPETERLLQECQDVSIFACL